MIRLAAGFWRDVVRERRRDFWAGVDRPTWDAASLNQQLL